MKKSFYRQWELRTDNRFFPASETTTQLPSGYYDIKYDDDYGYYIQMRSVVTEDIIQIQAPEFESVVNDIRTFWEKRALYKQNNLIYKRGILLFGAPGTGKSYIIQQLTKEVINNNNGIVISLSSALQVEYYTTFAPSVLRAIEPNRPLIVVIEEIDELILSRGYHDTAAKLLNMLDGLTSVDGGTVYIATTNHIEKIREHFTNRPGRFDLKRKIELPSDKARLHFFESKLKPDEHKKYDLQKWVRDTKGMSLAHLKELVIAIVIMNKDYQQTINSLKSMADKASSRDDGSKIGF